MYAVRHQDDIGTFTAVALGLLFVVLLSLGFVIGMVLVLSALGLAVNAVAYGLSAFGIDMALLWGL